MVNLGQIIEHLYPDAFMGEDWYVTDEGEGPYLAHWNEEKLGSQPTPEQLAAAKLPALKAQKRRELEQAFDAETQRDFPSAYLLIAVFATDARDARVVALRSRLQKLRDLAAQVEAATTEADVEAVGW
jgi:hypothetical protein